MVWFQCEDCGDNLKKPKLPNHFRICSATKLSCIDCGELFGQDSVQSHNQCITEAEKYGIKGQGKAANSNSTTPKSDKNTKKQPDVDINVGLSERPPWFCSLCNTKATSKQTLLLHADGKKHHAKARAFHAKQLQDKQREEPVQGKSAANGVATNGELHDNKHVEGQKVQDMPEADKEHVNSEMEPVKLQAKRKRKLDESGIDENDTGNGVIQVHKAKAEESDSQLKKAKHNGVKDDKIVESGSVEEDTNKKIKLKKLIKSALRTKPDGKLKMKKLKKLVLKSLQESGIMKDETQLSDMIAQKINSSSKFRVDHKYAYLAVKD